MPALRKPMTFRCTYISIGFFEGLKLCGFRYLLTFANAD